LYDAYREAQRPLQRAIKEAKRRAWDELLATLDSDPWVRSYRLVLNKLRPWAPPTMENMDPQFPEEVVGALFAGAVNEEEGRTNEERELRLPEEEPRGTTGSWNPESAITVEKIGVRKAPGPDRVPARVCNEIAGVLAPRLRTLFDRCLSRSEFPILWKEGRMVLLPKSGRSPDSPAAFHPVCMLDKAGKLLERIVAARLESHLFRRAPGLHDSQFDFRK
jgi:hypothetical protein